MLLNPKKTQQSGGSHNVEDIDPFDAPVPGQSLTDEPGKWPWDKPPTMSDPDDAVEYVVQKIEDNQDTKDGLFWFKMDFIPYETFDLSFKYINKKSLDTLADKLLCQTLMML